MIANELLPIRAQSLNVREHWRARNARVKKEREATRLVLGPVLRARDVFSEDGGEIEGPIVVTFTRYGPRELDSDNLAGSCKAIRDEVASLLGRDDSPKSGIEWRYRQAKGEHAVGVLIERGEP